VAHTDTKDGETPDSGESRPSTRRAATQARMGLAQGHGGLIDRAGWAAEIEGGRGGLAEEMRGDRQTSSVGPKAATGRK
jgi:hypothetical protein